MKDKNHFNSDTPLGAFMGWLEARLNSKNASKLALTRADRDKLMAVRAYTVRAPISAATAYRKAARDRYEAKKRMTERAAQNLASKWERAISKPSKTK